jgi:hypothetical protein
LTPAVNLPTVSPTVGGKKWNNIRLLTPESELKEKIYLYVNSTNQDVQTKYLKLFLLKIFSIQISKKFKWK